MMLRVLAILFLFSLGAADSSANDFRKVGRYYLVKNELRQEQIDPLKQFVDINFPASVETIEQAYRYLLHPTGYQLANLNSIDPKFFILSKNKLPVSQRNLKGKVVTLLNILSGSDFIVVRDDLSRTIAVDFKGANNG